MSCYFPKSRLVVLAAGVFLCAGTNLSSQTAVSVPSSTDALSSAQPSLTSSQIVGEMMNRNRARAQELRHYESVRHYAVEYNGYKVHIAASMVVEATYDAATGKSFRIVSQKGNGLLVDKVLKRLVESEKDADHDKASTALTPANYRFTLSGLESVDGRPAYVLEVEPLVESKYLYRGKIWVDAAEFAVAKIAAAPAKNPSVWISSTEIDHQYTRTGGFWLPAENRSESKVRVGGTAVLTIDYGKYQVQGLGTRD